MTAQERHRLQLAVLLLATRPIPARVRALTAREVAPDSQAPGWPAVWADLVRAVATAPVDVAGMLRQAETAARLLAELVPEPEPPAWFGIDVSVVPADRPSDLSPWFRRPAVTL